MKTTLVAFALRPWRASQHWTQAQAAAALGLSLSAYRAAEYRSDDRGTCSKTLALLATALTRRAFVVMSNDFPDAVFAAKEAAEAYAEEENRKNKDGVEGREYGTRHRIYYRCYDFSVRH